MKLIQLLIIEDETPIRDMIKFALNPMGFELIEASDSKEALVKLSLETPGLILLDWMLPGLSGIEFAKQLKKNPHTQNIPIIMLTAKAEEENKIKGLEIGADDYITKPFSPRELAARIKTVLRRGPLIQSDGMMQVDKLAINVNTNEVYIDNNLLVLTTNEYKLLYFFLTHQERIYSREQLLDQIWGKAQDINDRSVDVQVRRLRSRLEPYGCDKYIKTVRGYGYQCRVTSL
jgi:two-component system phosphate regulon response regulator PhoB